MGFLDDYEPVEVRLEKFWEDHPEGRIVTELVEHNDGDYIFRCEVFKLPPVVGATTNGGMQLPDATGYAHDSTAQLPNNMKASALEVCETSAIGRALANMGYAPKGKRPSREEMSKSQRSEPAITEGAAGSDKGGTGEEATRLDGASLGAPVSPEHVHEPHDHIPGKKLASGKYLCAFEFGDGSVCGVPFKPTILTAPVEESEVRADML